ncbi:YolD-like family protein [Cytobacillus oceanisediminis]|uniref:YolD-like family protein n=1 Tax=Cytobacillus oceanisediminis TaxID=665099 RepID=UPI001D145F8E|nr:YolD-like family protein [Cytobacillus oceanisediminis]MCC3645840.1 YolD-like family protein [Cytobacillus oceanisediminis]
MPIKDRGMVKWLPAHFMPEQRAMLKNLEIEQNYQDKPLLDEYEIEEFENKIHYAMEFAFFVKVKVWRDGFFHEFKGRVNRLDGINKLIYLQMEEYIQRIKFGEIIAVDVIE